MRTQKQIEANYTELVHAGEGITVEKGKISATGGSGGGGLTLYGPYMALNENAASLDGHSGTSLDLKSIIDAEGNSHDYPPADIPPILILNGFFTGNMSVNPSATYLPYINNGEWIDSAMEVSNNSDDVSSIGASSAGLVFYSSIEFPLAD